MIKINLIGILILWSAFPVLATNSFNIPFRMIKNLIVIQATVEGQPGNFIIDSGIPEIILNRAYFEGNTNPIGGGRFQSIHGETQANQGDHIQLHLGGLSLRSYAAVIDLSSIEKKKRLNILGLVGLRVFKRYEIMIDHVAQQIILYDLDKKGNRLQQKPLPIPSSTLAFQYKQHVPYISVWIDNMNLKLGLDTGIETNVFSPRILDHFKDRIGDFNNKTVICLNGNSLPYRFKLRKVV